MGSKIKFYIFPDDSMKIAWDWLIILSKLFNIYIKFYNYWNKNYFIYRLLLFTALYLPVNIAFNSSMNDVNVVDLFTNILFGIDILLSFITCYYDKNDDLITNRLVTILNKLRRIKKYFLLNRK